MECYRVMALHSYGMHGCGPCCDENTPGDVGARYSHGHSTGMDQSVTAHILTASIPMAYVAMAYITRRSWASHHRGSEPLF